VLYIDWHCAWLQEKSSGRSAHYKLTSTAMLWLQTSKAASGTMNLGGSLTRQVTFHCFLVTADRIIGLFHAYVFWLFSDSSFPFNISGRSGHQQRLLQAFTEWRVFYFQLTCVDSTVELSGRCALQICLLANTYFRYSCFF